ncbi:MAG: hypothetical protein QOE17_990 [Gaiellales bacterium]|nr:hypothetical protein [Gaiellales bacterium]
MLVRVVPMSRAVVARMVTAFVAARTRVVVVFDAALVVPLRVLRAPPVGVMMTMVLVFAGIRSVTTVVAGVRAGAGGRTGLRPGAWSRRDDRAATGGATRGATGRRRGRSAARVGRRILGIAVAAR